VNFCATKNRKTKAVLCVKFRKQCQKSLKRPKSETLKRKSPTLLMQILNENGQSANENSYFENLGRTIPTNGGSINTIETKGYFTSKYLGYFLEKKKKHVKTNSRSQLKRGRDLPASGL
jgi:hypothetical protein